MKDLLAAILEEEEQPHQPGFTAEQTTPGPEKIAQAQEILTDGIPGRPRTCLAFSGGDDSIALLDLAAKTKINPTVIWTDTGMDYPDSADFIKKTVASYGLELRTARPTRQPLDQWQETGWPFLGKMAARVWTQKNKNAGFKLNVSECCRNLKITPGRRLTRNLGCGAQITGQRGQADDGIRGLRTIKDGFAFYNKKDRIWILNPLTGWTDAEIAGYINSRRLERHPAKARGARTIGCVFCGGGSQYTNSGLRVLRKTWPDAWRKFIVAWGAGRIVLSLKHQANLEDIDQALTQAGGLRAVAETRPWIFDFTRKTPIPGYKK